jgi:energy-converting hydrogenase Eha subunit E
VLQSLWRRNGLSGAAVRLVALLAGACLLVLAASVPLGLAAGSSLDRAVSLGFYLLGAFLVVLGLLAGNRGPFRRVDEDVPTRRERKLRRATRDEMVETINVSVLMVTIGFVLIVIGVAIDDRYRLI